MNANEAIVWVEVAGKAYKIGVGVIESILAALRSAGVEADQARLDEIHADYTARIARAEAAAAGGSPTDGP